jgi:ABC-type multidrug transport system fused ATPase/permease subunit
LNWQQQIAQGNQNALRLILLLVPMSLLVIHVLRGGSPAAAALLCGCAIVVYRSAGHLDRLNSLSTEGSEHADEIATYLNRIPTVSQTPGASFLQPLAKTLTFNQLSFQTAQFPGLIRNLDLRINSGERLALLSLQPTAAYALASMVPRFVDPDLGQVLIDGRDIREATLESLRAESIFIGGHDPVFNASALDNITCGQGDITRQQAIEAAKLVHADQFIRTLPKGYDTVLGEHGVSLDAGQIFRLSLARAVVRQPALLIIEEPAVSLDQETKALLDDAYQRVCTNRTVIFLPHRLSTVKRCSRIILLHEGRVAVDGVHDQLVKSSELYRHWEYVRFNPFRDETE